MGGMGGSMGMIGAGILPWAFMGKDAKAKSKKLK